MKYRITIGDDGIPECETGDAGLGGVELIDCAATTIAAAITSVEMVWRHAGMSDTAQNAGRRALVKALEILAARMRVGDGKIAVKTQRKKP